MSNKFIVANERGIKALPRWVEKLGCNTFSFSSTGYIAVGYDTKPDSDWGGRYTKRGGVVVRNPELFEATEQAIRAGIQRVMKSSESRAEAFAKAEIARTAHDY